MFRIKAKPTIIWHHVSLTTLLSPTPPIEIFLKTHRLFQQKAFALDFFLGLEYPSSHSLHSCMFLSLSSQLALSPSGDLSWPPNLWCLFPLIFFYPITLTFTVSDTFSFLSSLLSFLPYFSSFPCFAPVLSENLRSMWAGSLSCVLAPKLSLIHSKSSELVC